jgi:hypothetical protein
MFYDDVNNVFKIDEMGVMMCEGICDLLVGELDEFSMYR